MSNKKKPLKNLGKRKSVHTAKRVTPNRAPGKSAQADVEIPDYSASEITRWRRDFDSIPGLPADYIRRGKDLRGDQLLVIWSEVDGEEVVTWLHLNHNHDFQGWVNAVRYLVQTSARAIAEEAKVALKASKVSAKVAKRPLRGLVRKAA